MIQQNLGKDCSTNGNNGTPTGGVSAVAGKAGGAALFGGFNNPGVIRVPNSPTLQFGTTSSISFFVKIDDRSGMDGNSSTVMSPNGNFSIVAKRHDQQGVFWNLSVNAANQLWLGFGASSGSMTTTPGTDVLVGLASGATGRWVHVVQVVDSVGFKTYFDGQLAWSMSGTVNFAVANTQDMYIGKYSDYWYPLNGTLDELKIFNRALSAAEVQSLYGSVTYPLTASASPAASGSVSGAGSYAAGATRSVVATANPGYAFSSWSGYAACASVNPCTFTMPAAAVNLTAVFVAAPPKVVSFNPATLSFTDQSVGTTSPAKTVILTNTGNAALSITSVLSSINVFGVTHNCGNSLAAGAACNLSVTFKPTAVGTRAGSITLTSNAAGSPHSVTVSGFGVSPNAPICTLSATPATVRKNGPSTLTASCSPPATSYSWTGGTCAGKTASTCMVSPSVTTTYSVTGTNSYGSNTSAATVTVNAVDLTPILMLLLD
jgi:hypothetical protein